MLVSHHSDNPCIERQSDDNMDARIPTYSPHICLMSWSSSLFPPVTPNPIYHCVFPCIRPNNGKKVDISNGILEFVIALTTVKNADDSSRTWGVY